MKQYHNVKDTDDTLQSFENSLLERNTENTFVENNAEKSFSKSYGNTVKDHSQKSSDKSSSSNFNFKNPLVQKEIEFFNDEKLEDTHISMKMKEVRYVEKGIRGTAKGVGVVGKVLQSKEVNVKKSLMNGTKSVIKSLNTEVRNFNPKNDDNIVGKAIIDTKNTAYTATKSTVNTYKIIKNTVLFLKNTVAPIVLKMGLGFIIPPALFMFVVFQVITMLLTPLSSTHAAEDIELNNIYKYATEARTGIELKFLNYDVKGKVPEIKPENITFKSDVISSIGVIEDIEYLDVANEFVSPYDILNILSTKYEDELKFTDETKIFIDNLFNELYLVDFESREEIILEDDLNNPIVDPDGNPILDPEGNPTYEQIETIVYFATVYLKENQSFSDWFSQNKSIFFNTTEETDLVDKLGYLEDLKEFGFDFKRGLLRPFDDDYTLSSGYGYRVDPNSPVGEDGKIEFLKEFHNALDIPKPADTPIKSPIAGTATVGFAAENYGLNVIIANGSEKIRLGHCNALAVIDGQQVNEGDVIAYVGSTGGTSTGNHVHLEYFSENENLNPEFFIEKLEE